MHALGIHTGCFLTDKQTFICTSATLLCIVALQDQGNLRLMRTTTIPLKLKSWNRFKTPYLFVCADLLGKSHTFTQSGRQVTITLPGQPTDGTKGKSDRLSLFSYRQGEGEHIIPIDYKIQSVDVSIDVDDDLHLPPEILQRNPKAVDILTQQQVASLDQCADESHNLALKAFEFWIRMLRWRTELHLIGRDEPDSPETGWSTYLVDVQTDKRVWIGTQSITLYTSAAISTGMWGAVQAHLFQADRIPISFDLYFDSLYHLHIGDLERAIADAAVAAESHVRGIVQDSIPSGMGPELRRLIDEANIRPIIQRVYGEALSFNGTSRVKVPSEIHELFDYRNKILHKGMVNGLTKEKCRKLIVAVKNLLWDKG